MRFRTTKKSLKSAPSPVFIFSRTSIVRLRFSTWKMENGKQRKKRKKAAVKIGDDYIKIWTQKMEGNAIEMYGYIFARKKRETQKWRSQRPQIYQQAPATNTTAIISKRPRSSYRGSPAAKAFTKGLLRYWFLRGVTQSRFPSPF